MADFDFLALTISQFWSDAIKLSAAFLLALPVAWEREHANRIMGLRTFPLVALGSCAYILVGTAMVDQGDDWARLIQGLMSGIGFIGGGAILKDNRRVRGTATASSVWTTGAVGAAVGFGRYEIAVIVVVLNYVVLRWLAPLKDKIHDEE